MTSPGINEDSTLLYNIDSRSRSNLLATSDQKKLPSQQANDVTLHLIPNQVDYSQIERQLLSQYFSPITQASLSEQSTLITPLVRESSHLVSNVDEPASQLNSSNVHDRHFNDMSSDNISSFNTTDNILLRTQKINMSRLNPVNSTSKYEHSKDALITSSYVKLDENLDAVSSHHDYLDPENRILLLSEQNMQLESQLHLLQNKLSEVISSEERKKAIAKFKLERIRRKRDEVGDWIISIINQYEHELEIMKERLQRAEAHTTQMAIIEEKLGTEENHVVETLDHMVHIVNTAVPKMQTFVSDVCQTIEKYESSKEVTPKNVVPILENLYSRIEQTGGATSLNDLRDDDTSLVHFMKLFGVDDIDHVKPKMNALFMYTSQAKHYLQTVTSILDQDVLSDRDKVENCKKLLKEWK